MTWPMFKLEACVIAVRGNTLFFTRGGHCRMLTATQPVGVLKHIPWLKHLLETPQKGIVALNGVSVPIKINKVSVGLVSAEADYLEAIFGNTQNA